PTLVLWSQQTASCDLLLAGRIRQGRELALRLRRPERLTRNPSNAPEGKRSPDYVQISTLKRAPEPQHWLSFILTPSALTMSALGKKRRCAVKKGMPANRPGPRPGGKRTSGPQTPGREPEKKKKIRRLPPQLAR